MNPLCRIILFCLLAAGLPLAALAGQIQDIQSRGELVVSINNGYPPFAMTADNKVIGLDVDLAGLLADALGVKVKFVQPPAYDQQIPMLLSGKTDIIMAAMTRTLERGLKVNFSQPYFRVSQAAMVRRNLAPPGAESYFSLVEINDLKLGVKAHTTHEVFARQLFPKDAIQLFPTAAAAAQALVNGEINAMAADSPFVMVWKERHPEHYLKIKPLLAPVTREYYAFAIRKGDPEFLTWLNLFIDQIKSDSTLDLLFHEYFERMPWIEGRDTQPAPNRAQFLKNRFIQDQQQRIETRRQTLKDSPITYD